MDDCMGGVGKGMEYDTHWCWSTWSKDQSYIQFDR